jgi:hypothetical protein
MTANTSVNAILPVTLADPGIKPNIIDQNKKENGKQIRQNFLYFGPRLG